MSPTDASLGSLRHPTDATLYRSAVITYYRVAIAARKTITFPHPSGSKSTTYFGTDGGLHNFLRFLENWNGDTLYYKGSLVSLFYSTYNTGTFKCCNYVVYEPPTRNYNFVRCALSRQTCRQGRPCSVISTTSVIARTSRLTRPVLATRTSPEAATSAPGLFSC